MSKAPVDILRTAKDHISSPGRWMKGGFCPSGDWYRAVGGEIPCCIEGAIGFAGGDIIHDSKEYVILTEALGGRYPCAFNDDDKTTHADVMDALDRAIAIAEKASS
jgi:hypothetical protein